MIFIFPIALALVFLGLWYYRRGSTLTRACRWRLDRSQGPGHFRCAACGAEIDVAEGAEPRVCLNRPRPNPQA